MEKELKVTARITAEEDRKLTTLARAARRTKSDVIRLLINNVQPEQFRPSAIRVQAATHES